MVDVQNATLAGGIAVGSLARYNMLPWGALVLGFVGGLVSVLGSVYVTPKLEAAGIHDTRGVHNLHGLPGVVSGFASACALWFTKTSHNGSHLEYMFRAMIDGENGSADFKEQSRWFSDNRGKNEQGAFQLACLVTTMAISLLGGYVTGKVMAMLPGPDAVGEDGEEFEAEDRE